jgi:hypothetical protein
MDVAEDRYFLGGFRRPMDSPVSARLSSSMRMAIPVTRPTTSTSLG